MSSTVDFATVANAISGLSISGVTVQDVSGITDAIGLGANVLSPRPKNFVTGLRIEEIEVTKQKLNVYYTLNYVYYHTQIGGLGGLFGTYADMIGKLALIVLAFCGNAVLAGTMDSGKPRVGQIAGIPDAAGNIFHSCEISIDILQFLEV
jgi:hypothetical protein